MGFSIVHQAVAIPASPIAAMLMTNVSFVVNISGCLVMGIATGGTTPYVHGALKRAIERGAKTIFLSCVAPFAGETSLFITPGYRFRIVDRLLTNFHLPRSTLFMLVSAFSGLDLMRRAYAHAVAERYRFYSYGDACLLSPARSAS